VITLSQLVSLTTATIVPDKRSLTPPCSVTYNGQTYPTYVELDGMTVNTNPYTGDCGAVVQSYCDVHLEFACAVSAGCLFEIDQTWFAAGYTYPVNTQGAGSISQGTVINATGFLYIDDHGTHELHPTVNISIAGTPPATCSNGAIAPPTCTTCPNGYIMQNGTCVIGGSGGGSGGGSTKAPGGGCSLCGLLPQETASTWILIIGGFLGLNGLLVVKTMRSRSELQRVKRRLQNA
jgi:hypothetical protein